MEAPSLSKVAVFNGLSRDRHLVVLHELRIGASASHLTALGELCGARSYQGERITESPCLP